MKKLALICSAAALISSTGCSDNKPAKAPTTNEGGVQVTAPNVDVKAGNNGVDVKTPGADVKVETK